MSAAAAVGLWLERQRAQGAARVELWLLVTPQRRVAVVDIGGARDLSAASREIDLCARRRAAGRGFGRACGPRPDDAAARERD